MGFFKKGLDRGRALVQKRHHNRQPLPEELSGWLAAPEHAPPVQLGYVRLAVDELDENSAQPQGIFRAAGRLQNSAALRPNDLVRLSRALRWFNHNLVAPRNIQPRAVFWFKLSAIAFRTKAWPIVRVLRKYGEQVRMMTSTRPGKIVYRDDAQVAVIPYFQKRQPPDSANLPT